MTRVLLDTHVFLWIAWEDAKLSPRALDLFRDPSNEVFLSAVSAWEIAVKYGLGKLPLPAAPDRLIPELREAHGIRALPMDEQAALKVMRLPDIHRDPFDRMLISQAIQHGLVLITSDENIHQYPVQTAW